MNNYNIPNLLKQIVLGGNSDPFTVHVAQVLTDTECATIYNSQVGREFSFDPDNNTFAVKILTDESSSFPGFSEDQETIWGDDIPTIYPSVRLQAGVANGSFSVPMQGSNVYIGVRNGIDPFLMLPSEISFTIDASLSADQLTSTYNLNQPSQDINLLTNNGSSGSAISGSIRRQTPDIIYSAVSNSVDISYGSSGSFTYSTTSATSISEITQNTSGIALDVGGATPTAVIGLNGTSANITINPNLQLTMNSKFNVTNGPGINLADVIRKGNNYSQDLNNFVNSIDGISGLNYTFMVALSGLTTGPLAPIGAAANIWLTNYAAISTPPPATHIPDYSALVTEINNLLG